MRQIDDVSGGLHGGADNAAAIDVFADQIADEGTGGSGVAVTVAWGSGSWSLGGILHPTRGLPGLGRVAELVQSDEVGGAGGVGWGTGHDDHGVAGLVAGYLEH